MNPKTTFSLTPAALPRKTTLPHGAKLSAENRAAVRFTQVGLLKHYRTKPEVEQLKRDILRMILAEASLKEIGFALSVSQSYLNQYLRAEQLLSMRVTPAERLALQAARKGSRA